MHLTNSNTILLHLITLFSTLLTLVQADVVVVTTIVATISTTTTTSPTSTPPPPSYTNPSTLKSAALNATDTYRTLYNATLLSWNTSLSDFATSHASHCIFQHSGGPSGENLAAGYATPGLAIDAWADEAAHYDFGKGGFSEETGHFTQLVWKGSKSVGCGVAQCNGEEGTPGWYLVCEYWPAGNVIGEFMQEVQGMIKGKGLPEGNLVGAGARVGMLGMGVVGAVAMGVGALALF